MVLGIQVGTILNVSLHFLAMGEILYGILLILVGGEGFNMF